MKAFKASVSVLACFMFLPIVVFAQVDVSLKARVTGFGGKFGDTYAAIGYEPTLLIKPSEKPWAGGISYSRNILVFDANSDMRAGMSILNTHFGAKTTVARYFHPFAYALLGLRFMTYENDDHPSESSSGFTSISLGYGARTGLQIGGDKWRFEGSIEYLSGTTSRYLTPASFSRATQEGGAYRNYTSLTAINGVTVAAGIVYVIDLGNNYSDQTID
ncbi:hypothetical protein [Pontibacter pudoricolor]|uniref:hypothetical protein n=1 Tax=Pontibacter pudoricolor TaxID=2694930 RepID=UPI001391B772|nr:hypothetical protein [Pontibacter pudoricolor]